MYSSFLLLFIISEGVLYPFLFHSKSILSIYLILLTPLNIASFNAASISSKGILLSIHLLIVSYSTGDKVLPNSFSNLEYISEELSFLSFSIK